MFIKKYMINSFNNEALLDRFLRFLMAEIFILLAFFWLSGIWQIILYILGVILLLTAILGFCPLYRIFKINTKSDNLKPIKKVWKYALIVIIIVFPVIASYYSAFVTRKIFLEDYNQMNNYYKQLLFNTGQGNRAASINDFYLLENEYAIFQNKYLHYKPYVIKGDSQFDNDLDQVAHIISDTKDEIYASGLNTEHVKLEAVRSIFQDMLKRNGFSILAVYLVDFHDSMEKIIEAADEHNAQAVIASYNEADSKLKSIEEVDNNEDIINIRKNLDSLLYSAQSGDIDKLSEQAASLKSSFVKVYLQKG